MKRPVGGNDPVWRVPMDTDNRLSRSGQGDIPLRAAATGRGGYEKIPSRSSDSLRPAGLRVSPVKRPLSEERGLLTGLEGFAVLKMPGVIKHEIIMKPWQGANERMTSSSIALVSGGCSSGSSLSCTASDHSGRPSSRAVAGRLEYVQISSRKRAGDPMPNSDILGDEIK